MKDAALTPLAVFVLALLREGDMHPYEMMRLLRHRRDDRMVKLTNGTFYHTVTRLERCGLIAQAHTDRDGNRPERTTYTLARAGHPALIDWVREHLARTDRSAEFRVALAESHNLPRDEVATLLTTRREALASEHADVRAGLDNARADGVPEQFMIEVDRQAAVLSAELDWTDAFLARLGRADYPWGVEKLPAQTLRAYQALRKAARQ